MITRRVGLAVPAAAAIVLAGLVASASAVVPPYEPVDVEDPLVVADVVEDTMYGLEVGPRAITWAGSSFVVSQYSPTVRERGYTPDLGKTALALGTTLTPAVERAVGTSTTDEWAVGFDPYYGGSGGESYVLRVRHDGGPESVIEVGLAVAPWTGEVAVWGDTALVGRYVVNLNSGDVFELDNLGCLVGDRSVLADGLLLVRDACDGVVVALEVPQDGITQATLDDGAWTVVLNDFPDLLAYSRGLLVYSIEDGEDGPEIGYLRLDEPEAEGWREAVPFDVVALRAHGHRFVLVASADGILAALVLEAQASEPLMSTMVLLEGGLIGEAPALNALGDVGDLAADSAPLRGDTSEMSLDAMPVDLYGRTLAWSTGDEVVAATLPPLADGAVTAKAPGKAKAGAAITVTAAGLQAGEEVAVWLESDPELLVLGYAGADGRFSASINLPAGIAPGAHTLTIQGVESGWSSAAPITIAAAGGTDGTGNPGLVVDTGR